MSLLAIKSHQGALNMEVKGQIFALEYFSVKCILEVRQTESRKIIMMLLSCYSIDRKSELRQVDEKKEDGILKNDCGFYLHDLVDNTYKDKED